MMAAKDIGDACDEIDAAIRLVDAARCASIGLRVLEAAGIDGLCELLLVIGLKLRSTEELLGRLHKP